MLFLPGFYFRFIPSETEVRVVLPHVLLSFCRIGMVPILDPPAIITAGTRLKTQGHVNGLLCPRVSLKQFPSLMPLLLRRY